MILWCDGAHAAAENMRRDLGLLERASRLVLRTMGMSPDATSLEGRFSHDERIGFRPTTAKLPAGRDNNSFPIPVASARFLIADLRVIGRGNSLTQ